MSFAISQTQPSTSSDSGSSASLTPTANNSGMLLQDTGYGPPASSSGGGNSLFSSEESKFITDSLSSAESFDPFTIGAPGFKVPSLLPPNIAANHDHIPSSHSAPTMSIPTSSSAGLSGSNLSLASPSSGGMDFRAIADQMRARNPSTHAGQFTANATGPSTQHHQQLGPNAFSIGMGDPSASHRFQNWNLYGHRAGIGGASPNAGYGMQSNFAPSAVDAANTNYGHGARHASFSGMTSTGTGPSHSLGGGVNAAGYGKNKAWQMEQLSFLEAQAGRGQQPQQPDQPQQQNAYFPQQDHLRRASTSALGSGSEQYLPQPQQQPHSLPFAHPHGMFPQHQQGPYHTPHHGGGGGDDGKGGLAMLGAQFPSSHNFPSAPPPQQQGVMPNGGFGGAEAFGMLSGSAGLDAASQQAGTGAQTPKARKPSSSRTPTVDKAGPGEDGRSSTPVRGGGSGARGRSPNVAAASASPSSASALKRTNSGSAKPSSSSAVSGPSSAVTRALADLSHLEMDLDGARRILPPAVHAYFEPLKSEKAFQPHLDLLKQQHIEQGLMDASGHEIKKPPTKEEEEEEAEKEKKTHTLLTTEEKKANHIASEQKRRANIRKGYELLCEIVPSLREALEREAKKSKGGANRDGSSDEEDDEGDSGDEDGKGSVGKKSGSPSKKKVSGSSGKKGGSSGKDDDGGIEIDGEKIDGRAGPRSEAVVLMKSLDHIAVLLEKYRALLGRRNRARLALARKHGWTGLARQPVPDIERLLKLKVEEYFAAHGLESDDVESAERDTDHMHDD